VSLETLLFWTCCLSAIAGALLAATVRNLFHAALLLGLSLVGVAGLYLFLEAQWLACVQVVVYVGGILVLVLFATLFSSDVMGALQRTPLWLRAVGTLGALLAGTVAVRLAQTAMQAAHRLEAARGTTAVADTIDGDSTATIGDLLTSAWLVPFLAAGLLLTVALVAAVATVQRFRQPSEATPNG